MIVEATFFGLLCLAWYRASNKKGLSDERKKVYEAALENLTDTAKLRKLADMFDRENLKTEASMLRRRADYRDMPKDKKEAYRAVYEKAMTSEKVTPEKLEELALAFERITATGSGRNLRKRAKELRQQIVESAKSEARIKEAEKNRPVKEAKEDGNETVVETQAEVVSETPADAKEVREVVDATP